MATTTSALNSNRAAGLREITPEDADLDSRGIRHPPLVRELAFACWVDANGNADRARRLLIAVCERDKTGQLPKEDDAWPSANAIRRWAKRDGWEVQLIETVGSGYGHLLKLAAARLIQLHGQSIDVLDEVTSPGYVPRPDDKIRVDAAKHVTSIMANVMANMQTGQAALATHERQQQEQEFANATEANRFWISGGRTE